MKSVYKYPTRGYLLLLLFLVCPAVSTADDLLLAVHPYQTSSTIIKAFTPLVDYLGRELAMKVNLDVSPNYDAHIARIGKNQVDIAYLGPASYVRLVDKYGRKPIIARQVVNGKPYFQGKIIIRAGSSIKSLKDLVGKRFAFGDPESTMSHLVPRYMLINAGVDVSKLAGYQFTGSHDNVAVGVLAGDFDAGAVKEEVFYKFRSRGLEELVSTPEIPEHLFVARSGLPERRIDALRSAFSRLDKDPKGQEILGSIKKGIDSMRMAEDSDYDGLRKILAVLAARGVIP